MITDIYRIKTRNSIYEIQVSDNSLSRCRKEGEGWHQVKSDSGEYLEQLCIGPSFKVPGVVETSNVQDYVHFVPSPEPKRAARGTGSSTGIPEFFGMLAEHVKEQANPQQVMVAEPSDAGWTRDPGCSATCPGKDSPARHNGSRVCKSGSIASGGTRSHCTCDACY